MSSRVFLSCVLSGALVIGLSACSDRAGPTEDAGVDSVEPDKGSSCALAISSINGRLLPSIDELTASDDQDDTKAGIQIDVEVSGSNLDDDTVVTLSVTKLAPNPALAANGGKVTFEDVTIATDLTIVLIQASAEGCEGSPSVKLPLASTPECFFIDPPDGVGLSTQDDKNPGNDTFDYDVIIGTRNADDGTIKLEMGQWSSAPIAVDAKGQAIFTDTVLEIGDTVQLIGKVKVGNVERSCTSTISVSTGLPPCTITFAAKPVSTTLGRQGLGMGHDALPGSEGMQVDIDVITSTLVDKVTMKVNGASKLVASASGGKATFAAFGLPEGEVDLEAVCVESTSGTAGASAISKMVVDSKPPSSIDDFDCELKNRRTGEVQCCWTAVADAAQGTGVEVYDLRYSITGPVTAANWNTATAVEEVAGPAAGQPICVTMTNLALSEAYHLVVRAVDFVENNSTVAYPMVTPLDVDLKQLPREGPPGTSAWGQRIATGDFNCDGYTDLAVGDPSDLAGKGRVAIYVGNPNGYLQPTKFIIGTVPGGNFGAAVAALNDFDGNNDSCTDLAVLASHGDTVAARIYLYLGQVAFFQRTDIGAGTGAEMIFERDGALSGRIANIASAGDFDNDLATDLAIVYRDDTGDASEVWITYGTGLTKMVEGSDQEPVTAAVPSEAGVRLLGGVISQGFATGALCGAGPLDADAYGDLLISAADWQQGGQPRGAVYLLKGGTRATTQPENLVLDTTSRAMQIKGGAGNSSFGYAVGVVGDMDKDGTIEFVASDIGVDNAAGAVYVFNLAGTVSTTSDAVLTVTNGLATAADNKLGQTLTCPAELHHVDIDNDSYADLLAGMELHGNNGAGAVLMFSGSSSLPASMTASDASYVFEAPANSAAFGEQMSVAKDINNDGYLDLIVGDPYAGNTGRIVAFF